MNIRKFAYLLAVVILSYDSVSTMMASMLYGGLADLNPLYNFLWHKNPNYVCIVMAIVIVILVIAFLTALSCIESQKLSKKGLVILCDFFAVYLLNIGLIAVLHNTLVLFGLPGIVLTSKMLHSLKVASTLIAGVTVVIVDTGGGHQWLEKKLGWGLNSIERNLLKTISVPDKVQGINPAEISSSYTEFSDLGLNYIVEKIDKLESKGLVKSAIKIKGYVTTTQEGDVILRNRRIVGHILFNILIVAPLIFLAKYFSQNLTLFIIIGLILANIHPLFNFLFNYCKKNAK